MPQEGRSHAFVCTWLSICTFNFLLASHSQLYTFASDLQCSFIDQGRFCMILLNLEMSLAPVLCHCWVWEAHFEAQKKEVIEQ